MNVKQILGTIKDYKPPMDESELLPMHATGIYR